MKPSTEAQIDFHSPSAMGSGGSKPEQQIFNADAPVRFSQSVIDSLQNSSESDSTRAHDLELKIQTRVNRELQRIRDAQAEKLTSLTASLTTNPPKDDEKSAKPSQDPNSLAYHLSSPFYQDHSSPLGPEAQQTRKIDHTHDSVEQEIMDLRKKLEARKKVDKVPEEVEKAKESVVQCLRVNDRRPLDCWQEVERFKAEVGKLEQAYIQRVGR